METITTLRKQGLVFLCFLFFNSLIWWQQKWFAEEGIPWLIEFIIVPLLQILTIIGYYIFLPLNSLIKIQIIASDYLFTLLFGPAGEWLDEHPFFQFPLTLLLVLLVMFFIFPVTRYD
jgi:hypothetical protein